MQPGERARLVKDNDALRRRASTLSRELEQRDGTIAELHRRIRSLQAFGPESPADLFAPIRIEIVSRSGGANYDNQPGDDGVTVYLRPLDAFGDVVKAPGKITIQLLDNTDLAAPHLLGLYVFDDVERVARSWYGKVGTNHYTLKCPFSVGVRPPRSVSVNAEFVDYLTGATLTATKSVAVSYRSASQR